MNSNHDTNADFLVHIEPITTEDAEGLVQGYKEYGTSWKRRGGVGAYMMLVRKIDRIERAADINSWDIFKCIEEDERAEGIIDDIRDLRRYLTLVEAEMRARGHKSASTTHRDNIERQKK